MIEAKEKELQRQYHNNVLLLNHILERELALF